MNKASDEERAEAFWLIRTTPEINEQRQSEVRGVKALLTDSPRVARVPSRLVQAPKED